MGKFQVGDTIERVDGKTFTNGDSQVTVGSVNENHIYLVETKSVIFDGDYDNYKVVADENFSVGDKVQRKNGEPFSNSQLTCTIERIASGGLFSYRVYWLKETEKHLPASEIKKAPAVEEEPSGDLIERTIENLKEQKEEILKDADKITQAIEALENIS